MGWLLILAFSSQTIAIAVETAEECRAIARLNLQYWHATGQPMPIMVCTKTFEV